MLDSRFAGMPTEPGLNLILITANVVASEYRSLADMIPVAIEVTGTCENGTVR